jgi:hypothetical protein
MNSWNNTEHASSMIRRFIVICHSSEDWPLDYMENNSEDNPDG